MKRRLLVIALAAVVLASMVSPAFAALVPAATVPCDPSHFTVLETYDLLAGQSMPVGHVYVGMCDGKYGVQYRVDGDAAGDWKITEVHLSVATNSTGFPKTKSGNPIPGQFTVNESFADGVLQTPVFCFEHPTPGAPLFIAAHAVVSRTDCVVNATAPYGPNEVINSLQGLRYDNTPVKAIRSNPQAALVFEGTKLETDFFSLGFGPGDAVDDAYLVVRFNTPVLNGPGSDLQIVEDTWGLPYPVESCAVYASEDGVAWTYLGEANNQTPLPDGVHTFTNFDFDLGALSSASYVKVQDTSIRSAFGGLYPGQGATLDGFDVNAILSLQTNRTCTTYSQTAWGAGTRFPNASNWATYMTYQPAWRLVDTVAVSSNGSTALSSISLASGVDYKVAADGTYRFVNWANAGIADAGYSLRIPGSYNSSSEIAWISGDALGAYAGYLEVKVNGSNVDWGAFNEAHHYETLVTGTGGQLSAKILDNAYGDNSGQIMLTIYEFK